MTFNLCVLTPNRIIWDSEVKEIPFYLLIVAKLAYFIKMVVLMEFEGGPIGDTGTS